jgi:hypothetical protein
MAWPTPEQLRSMGFVQCKGEGCTTFMDPANVSAVFCLKCQKERRQARRDRRNAQVDAKARERARRRSSRLGVHHG